MQLQPLLCAVFGTIWAIALGRGSPEGTARWAARALLGGLAAFAAAWSGYALLDRAGMRISWDEVTSGGTGAVASAAAIGLVEEGAKLLGMVLVSIGLRTDRGTVARTVLGVSAGFATLESMIVLAGAAPGVLVLRALLAPVAHAALSVPLAAVLAGGPRAPARVVPSLLLAASLHAASDLALATPGIGRIGYAAVLSAPVVFLHLQARFGWARPRVGRGIRAA